ncbi:Unknown protein [Striga hermonthica]|uniref:Uncharacterized protein n=1 Tax=Striga hermonthica TaxID=68872 RepID=A0A9N7NRN1_STRHE|nr:Unknown protein [Striga hermonthica]
MSSYPQPGALTGQQQQQQPIFNFSSAIPIKKRRFPVIRSPSPPPPEENISGSEIIKSKNEKELKSSENNESKNKEELKISKNDESKNQQESKIQDEEKPSLIDATNASSPGNSDVRKPVSPINADLGQPNVENLARMPHEAKPAVNLSSVTELGAEVDILPKEKSPEPEVPESCTHSQTVKVKQETLSVQNNEGICGLELSTASMSVELSLGPKESAVPSLEHEKDEVICNKPGKSDPSLLILALSNKNPAQLGTIDSTLNEVNSQVSYNRSNWDLNKTMDVWGSIRGSDAFADAFADVGGYRKMDDLQYEKSSLTTDGTIGVSLDKGKRNLDVSGFSSSDSTIQQFSQQCKTDGSLGLRLAMPHREMDVRKEYSSLSDNSVSTSDTRSLGLQREQISAANMTRPVKSEPVDENTKRDCSVGSSSSSCNVTGLLKLSSVKTEFVNNHRVESVLQPSATPNTLFYSGKSMKPEGVHEDNHQVCKSDDITLPQFFSRMQKIQESSPSSSFPLDTLPLMPHSLCSSSLPACTESIPVPTRDLSTRLEHCQELSPSCPDDKISRPSDLGNLSSVDHVEHKLARVDEDTFELDDDEKLNEPAKTTEEESLKSGCGSQGICNVSNSIDKGENKHSKEDEEYEDGEVREPIQCPNVDRPINIEKKMDNSEYFRHDSQNLQPLGDQDFISTSESDANISAKRNHQGSCNDSNDDKAGPNGEYNLLNKALEVLEAGLDEKYTINVTPDEQLQDLPAKEFSISGPAELEDADNYVVKETCSGEENNNSNLFKAEASLDAHDAAKNSTNGGNKSRIINLSRASAVTSPCKTRSIPKRLVTTRSGKERYSDLDGETQLRGNRDEFYTGSPNNKFIKDRAQDQDQDRPQRNPRSSFSNRRGRISNRFGSLHGDWDMPDHEFASEAPYGPSDYRHVRHKHKHASDVEVECNNGYDIQQDNTPPDRRKPKNDEFPSLRRTSLRRRLSPGDRENRNFPRFRNTSPNRHGDKFMRHLSSDDIINPAYSNNPQVMYDELDGQQQQLVRRNRNFSNMQRKGYSRNHRSKSRTRSPGPWSSPQNSRRSPVFYRTGRMRSPDRACFRDEIVPRRRGSPSYGPRNRRGSPERAFPRSGRRMDGMDSREMMGDCDEEYMNGSSSKFNERRGPARSFRTGYNNGNGENFRFHPNEDHHRPYRFCSDSDGEFVERGGGGMRDREFDGRVKNHHHQSSLGMSRRIRNVEEHEDGNYRSIERVWHDDGFSDGRGKRRRF